MDYDCLVIDDERPLADSTAEYFNLFGILTKAVYDEADCLAFFGENSAGVILLDINLEQSSGFDLCRLLREMTAVPILFISARESDDDILLALNIGGDDYIKKPYTLSVLLAKVKAVLKRQKSLLPVSGETEDKFCCGKLMVDFHAGRTFVDGKPLRQKAMEYKLLCYLIHNRGRIIPKEELFEKVWEDRFTGDGTLNVHIRHLREQIEADAACPVMIQTIWGKGYLFEDTEGKR